MKKAIFSLALALFFIIPVFAQLNDAINYQAVVRDSSGNIYQCGIVNFKISLLRGSENGPIVYEEEHLGDSTNNYGLINLNVGEGIPTTNSTGNSYIYNTIDWGNQKHFLKIEIDIYGTGYEWMGTSELASVPYSLHSIKAKELDKPFDAGIEQYLMQTPIESTLASDTIVIITDIDYKPKKIVIFMQCIGVSGSVIGESDCDWFDRDQDGLGYSRLTYYDSLSNKNTELIENTRKVGMIFGDVQNFQYWEVETYEGYIKLFPGESQGLPPFVTNVKLIWEVK
ncbi:MAG: hypothetical protein HN704_12595 [Bacteroidetes bacterium]|jgi:hypothetical protein|nr:hypothetical protein [Bacteroidota bacterium]MBT6687377.1 hypothetical protein [Bacteroidota bacterium]MBT7143928.1 hypothetical protein [Bacteroidota bacterium]MBT7492432.1 hypothetical protein [Bacteroidota bacterium]